MCQIILEIGGVGANITECDGEFPCKRCKDDGLVCTAAVRKKMEYKQLPEGKHQNNISLSILN